MKKFIVRHDIPKDPALIIENQLLLGPGIWNGQKFTAEEIKRGIELTDWTDKQRKSIIYGHRVDGDASPDQWLGYHSTPEYREQTDDYVEGMYADLYIYDENLARKIAYGGAKAGVSERLQFRNSFDGIKIEGYVNLSIVDNPACKLAYLNLSDDGDVHTAEIMSPNFINLSEEKPSDDSNISSSSEQNTEDNNKDSSLHSTERRFLNNAKTEKLDVVNTENLSDKNNNNMENDNKQDSNVDTKYQELKSELESKFEARYAELEKKFQENSEKIIESHTNKETKDVSPAVEPIANRAVEITQPNFNREVVDAISKMSEKMEKVMTESSKIANPQSVARTNPLQVDYSSRDDEVVTKLVKQYEAMHNIQNE